MQCITSIVNSAFEGAEKKLGQNTFIKENRNFYKTKFEMFIIIAYSIMISQKIKVFKFLLNDFGGNNSLCKKRK